LRQLLDGYDTDVEPPLTPGQLNTTVNVSLNILCATSWGHVAFIESTLFMVRNK